MKREIKTARPMFLRQPKLLKDISAILHSGRLMNGKFLALFEKRFSEYCRVRHAIAVNSCTTAIEIVLRYIGIAKGEVIVPTNTFIATSNAVIFAGGRPVLTDIKEETYYLSPSEAKKRITGNTRAVIATHIAGLVQPEIDEIRQICGKKGLPLIEDCAHAAGSAYDGRMAGTFGLAGCFSFYPTKIMTTGSGGMIVTNDKGLADFARSVRLHGAGKQLSEIVNLGNDWFMDEVRCALGINQLEDLKYFIKKRRQIAQIYDDLLMTTGYLTKFPVDRLSFHSYYKYPVQVASGIDVAKLKIKFNKRYGFELESLYWPTCHLQPVYKKIFGYGAGQFPVAESILSRQIALPIHAGMSTDDAKYVFKCICTEVKKAC